MPQPLVPFSIAQYIAQSSGTLADIRGTAQLGNVNGVPSVLLKPTWVTIDNMSATVVKDGAVTVGALCVTAVATQCTAAGIK